MAELLLELFSEEIPARMQTRAREDLARLLGGALGEAGLEFKEIRTFATPRRLVAVVDGLPSSARRMCGRSGRVRASMRPRPRSMASSNRRGSRPSIRPRSATTRRALTTSRRSRSLAVPPKRWWRPSCRRSYAIFPGRNRCAGAPAGSAGCARCTPSSACSTARSCRSRSTASRAARRRAATASWRRSPLM